MQEFEVDEGGPKANTRKHRAHMGDHRHRGGHRALHRFRRRRRLDEPHPGREGAADRVRGANRPRGFRAEREPRGSLNRASTPPPPSAISCDGLHHLRAKGQKRQLRHLKTLEANGDTDDGDAVENTEHRVGNRHGQAGQDEPEYVGDKRRRTAAVDDRLPRRAPA